MENPIIVITGPTASGKTALSFELVKKFNGEIICVDSMTVYRGMDIGTDKPTLENQKSKLENKKESDGSYLIKGIKHHLINIKDPNEEFNAAICRDLTKDVIRKIHERGNIPFLVGGSLLYIDSYVYNYQMPEVKPDSNLRSELELLSNEELFAKLVLLDPDCEWTIDKNNRRRVIRALEIVIKTGKAVCNQKNKSNLAKNILFLAVTRPREDLYERINTRVDTMIKDGFLEEVKELRKKYDSTSALQAAGYKQLGEFLDDKCTKEEAIEKTKQVHRNFAKRQLTWLKRNQDVKWVSDKNQAEKTIKEFLNS